MSRKYTSYLAGILGLFLSGIGCGGTHRHPGYLDVAWDIVDSRTGQRMSCEWAGIAMVELACRNIRTGEDIYSSFNCVDGGGISEPLPPSEYKVAFYAYDNNLNNPNPVASYILPVAYPVYEDTTTQLPVISFILP